MRFSFSTVGCPYWDWPEILAIAKDFGYDGVEIRGIGRQMDLPRARELSGPGLASTIESLKRLGLAIPCLASSCQLQLDEPDQARELREYVDLAAALGTPYVRVLGDTDPEPGVGRDVIPTVVEKLREHGAYAASKGVVLLLETNGLFADSALMAGVMESCGPVGVGVLWDVHHPYRFMDEAVETTWGRLSGYVRHVHVKDSRRSGDGGISYTLVGQGDVPVAQALDLLKQAGFDGWASLEWVKRWRPDLEEPGLVFPHFIDHVRNLVG